MKKIILILGFILAYGSGFSQVSKSVNISGGGLSAALNASEKTTITNLTVSGTVDARDFKTMRDSMPSLSTLNLSKVSIIRYHGNNGTAIEFYDTIYPANTIPGYAFIDSNWQGKTNLISIILPDSLYEIGRGAFSSCNGLQSITIPSSVVCIDNEAFYNCAGLDSISIPSSVTKIGNYAFYSCTSLRSVTLLSSIPLDLNSSEDVFSNVDLSHCSLFIPFETTKEYQTSKYWKEFGHFIEMPGLFLSTNKVYFSQNAGSFSVYIASSSSWNAVSDKEWIKVTPLSSKGNVSFIISVSEYSGNIRTGSIILNSNSYKSQIINVIQYGNIFVTAGNLNKILGDQKTTFTLLSLSGTLDASDFRTLRDSMPALTILDIKDISVKAYSGSEGTNYYNDYPADIIPENAFYNKKNLKSIVLPSSIFYIGPYSFELCSGLTSIAIPSSVISIGSGAFEYCSGLETIDLTTSVESINSFAFMGCTKLLNISIPSSVTSIGNSAFWNCNQLQELFIPTSVDSIELYAFGLCSAKLDVDPNNLKYSSKEGILYNKSQTHLIQCPISKTGPFIIPSSVTTIEESAFGSCKQLTSVTIPESVTYIGKTAFHDCSGLKNLIVNWEIPPDLNYTFKPFDNLKYNACILYVPDGKVNLYRNAYIWKDFNIIKDISKLSIPVFSSESSFAEIYPNPTTGRFTVDLKNFGIINGISLFNTKGVKFYSGVFNSSKESITISNLPKGTYFVRISNNNSQITQKLEVK
jgi:hypothetical protein